MEIAALSDEDKEKAKAMEKGSEQNRKQRQLRMIKESKAESIN